jgi:hypothetical protein
MTLWEIIWLSMTLWEIIRLQVIESHQLFYGPKMSSESHPSQSDVYNYNIYNIISL